MSLDPKSTATPPSLSAVFKTLAERLDERSYDPNHDHATHAALRIVSNEMFQLASDLALDEPAID